ncbi:integrase, catalytic region, zinc finger, CCHC-type containing protein [Tanacetum coccineum]
METRSEADRTLDFRALDFQITELTEKVIAQIKGRMKCVTMDTVKPKLLAPGMYAIDVEPIPPHNKNNREVHLDYLKHLKESVETVHEIVEEELLEYVIGTCPKEFSKREKKVATAPLTKKKQVTFKETCETSTNNTQKHVEPQKVQKTNLPMIPSTGVISSTEASGSKPRSNTKKNKILPAKSDNKNKVEAHPRNNKSNLKQENRVDSIISSKRKLFTNVGYHWKPTRKKFTLGEHCPLTRFTQSKVVPLQQHENVSTSETVITERLSNTSQKPLTRYKRRNKQDKAISTSIPTTAETQTVDASVQFNAVSANQPDPNRNWGSNIPNSPSLSVFKCRTVRFRNDHFGAIMGYGDYVIGDNLEVAFRKHLCYVRNEDGVDLLKGSRGSNLYTISVEDMMKSSLFCLLSKASKNKSWLWHRRLNHLNFGTINDLARKDLVRGLQRLKFEKDHLCSAFLTEFYESVGIFHEKSIPRTPQQNGVVERRNHTLVEAARTMLIFSKALMFLWAEAIATACYTQNRSLIHTRHNKTPYELVHDKKLDLKFL